MASLLYRYIVFIFAKIQMLECMLDAMFSLIARGLPNLRICLGAGARSLTEDEQLYIRLYTLGK